MKTARLSKIALTLAVAASAAVSVAALDVQRPASSHLATIVRGGSGPPTLLLLHGYGAKAEDWEPFSQTIAVPPGARFVFPEAPEMTVPPDGPIGGRAWWRLDLSSHIHTGERLPDLADTHPSGLDTAAASVQALLRELSRSGPVVLGGFSQGAMVAGDLAFTTGDDIAALVLLSGTPVDEARWRQGLARRRGLPVFVSHGRNDPTLPFAASERLQRELTEAGLRVTWVPFDGGHDVPASVVAALNTFLAPIVHARR